MKVLVYVDPSARGEWALAPALDLAARLCTKLILLSTKETLQQHPQLLDAAAERFAEHKIEIIKSVRPGPPRKAILNESAESYPAITVVPPAGRWRFSRILHGSRVRTVVHEAPSTVMIARKPVSDHIRRILVTVSGGPMTETLIRGAQEIAAGLDAELSVLHVSSSVTIPFGEVRTEAPPTNRPLKEVLTKLSEGGVTPRFLERDGLVVREILSECHEGHYDLLILGQHLADRDMGGPLCQNLAEILAVECPIPVLIIRPRRWASAASGG